MARKSSPRDIREPGGRITTKGRLRHIDRWLIRTQNLKGRGQIRYLDIGCCPSEKGAYTTEDTRRDFHDQGVDIRIKAVDKRFPESFKSHQDYSTHDITAGPVRGSFDIVRYANVEPHIPKAKRTQALENVKASVGEGGFLIVGSGLDGYNVYRKEGAEFQPVKRFKTRAEYKWEKVRQRPEASFV